MFRLVGLLFLSFAMIGSAAAAPDTAATSSSSSVSLSTPNMSTASNMTSTYGSSNHKSVSYKFSHKYGGHGWHKPPKYKVVYRTCKKWKKNQWWWGYNKRGKLVKYVCKPHYPASC